MSIANLYAEVLFNDLYLHPQQNVVSRSSHISGRNTQCHGLILGGHKAQFDAMGTQFYAWHPGTQFYRTPGIQGLSFTERLASRDSVLPNAWHPETQFFENLIKPMCMSS